MFTLITTAPDGTVTRSRPMLYGPQVAVAVATILRTAAPWMTRRERDSAGMQVARGGRGVPLVHQGTGLVFRVETDPAVYVVTFDPRPVSGPGALNGLRRLSLADARAVVALAALIPKRGRIIDAETLEELPLTAVGGPYAGPFGDEPVHHTLTIRP